jgi:Uma2 family endonuclease
MGIPHAPHRVYTIEEYVSLEEYANIRHEFLDGQIYAMSGGTAEHSVYATNVAALLLTQLRGRPCRVQNSDARIRVVATGLDTYPDVSVVCGHAAHDLQDRIATTNPVVLVEVLSASTERYDRGMKLEHYKLIPTLREVVFVAYDARRIDVVRRKGDTWETTSANPGETLRLESIECELPVDEVYRDPLAEIELQAPR